MGKFFPRLRPSPGGSPAAIGPVHVSLGLQEHGAGRMAESANLDAIHEQFAELTGQLEDATMLAVDGQGARTVPIAKEIARQLHQALLQAEQNADRLKQSLGSSVL